MAGDDALARPLSVCFVVPGLGTGGAERSLTELLARVGDRLAAEVVCFYRRDEGVERSFTSEVDVPVSWLSAGHLPGRVRELRRHLRAREFDLVVSSVFEADLVSRCARIGLRGPVGVSTIINSPYEQSRVEWDANVSRPKLRAVQAVDALTAHAARDRFHAITEAAADSAIARLHLDPDRIEVVPRGRDRERLGIVSPERRGAVRDRLGLDPHRPVLLAVGRREYQKGHIHLVRALPEVASEVPDVVLLLAGREGNASSAIEIAMREAGVGDRVRLLGHRDDVADLMVAADLFVFPSLWEGFGGVLAEAMALSLPIVTTSLPEVREVVGDGDPGPAVVVPAADPGALARAMTGLLLDPSRRAEMGGAGRRRFDERYDLDRVSDAMIAMYRSFAGASGTTASAGRVE